MSKKTHSSDIPQELLNNLSFSDTTQQISALQTLIFSEPEINQAKIHFLKEELAAGRYEINSVHIAHKLLEYAHVRQQTEVA